MCSGTEYPAPLRWAPVGLLALMAWPRRFGWLAVVMAFDLGAITDLVRGSLHGWEVADNGEIVMVATTPAVRDRCAAHGTDRADTRLDHTVLGTTDIPTIR